MVREPKPRSKLFSSGTQSKHHAKFGSSAVSPKRRRIHSPPHGPGSKNGTSRKGRRAVIPSARRYDAPATSRGDPASFVSRYQSTRSSSSFFHRSAARQSTK